MKPKANIWRLPKYTTFFAGNIGFPLRSSAKIQPTNHMSTAGPYFVLPSSNSGGLQPQSSNTMRSLLDNCNMITNLWEETIPIPQSDHTVSKVSIMITREWSCKAKISQLQVALIVYQKVGSYKGSIKYNINKMRIEGIRKARTPAEMCAANTFNISMQHLIDMAIVQARKQLPHVTLEQDKTTHHMIIPSSIKPQHIKGKAPELLGQVVIP